MSDKTARNDVKVIDNYLSQEDFLQIKNTMMSNNFSWFYHKEVTYSQKNEDESFYFTHLFYINNSPNSSQFDLVLPLIKKINPKALVRIKGNLYPNLNKKIENQRHVDFDFQHKGAIFYINTNNGDTVLNDGTRIKAIENRILFFDPSKTHNSTHCTDEKIRLNININYF